LISENQDRETMGGYGSGRNRGRPTVESALRLDIDAVRRWGVIRPGAHLVGEMTFDFYDDKLRINFESCAEDPRESWLRLQYAINDYWTGELYQIDDKIYLAHSRPTFGGLRWWFVCPRLKRRVGKLYLPLGGRHFWSRLAYRLAYASQRETLGDRASRRARKICRRLGGDPEDDSYPDKPKRIRWNTYNRLMDKLVAADRLADYLADQRLLTFATRCVGR
jgi:hypothetical protein